MSKVGSSADNALAESFNATFKCETLQGQRAFTDEGEARLSSFRWLYRYNTLRRHPGSESSPRSPTGIPSDGHQLRSPCRIARVQSPGSSPPIHRSAELGGCPAGVSAWQYG